MGVRKTSARCKETIRIADGTYLHDPRHASVLPVLRPEVGLPRCSPFATGEADLYFIHRYNSYSSCSAQLSERADEEAPRSLGTSNIDGRISPVSSAVWRAHRPQSSASASLFPANRNEFAKNVGVSTRNVKTFCKFTAETFQTSRLCHTKKERLRWPKTEPSTRRNPATKSFHSTAIRVLN